VSDRRRVAVVTGGGGGIGAAIAEELGRHGWFVATVDPLVTLDGTERLPEPCISPSSRAETMADSEMHPTGTPPSTIGTWEMSFFSMISTALETGSPGPAE